ncbi:DUF11 domain-containing protein [Candidatus Gottesmanbacteria bacterium]|nr:DUF11 domain-containing protein [Candidatus Gottesmanbacteria bacterium]MBI5452396.1 DUF11 domain-containing protein [Candidatus Gottesmanbacteria bacterium]
MSKYTKAVFFLTALLFTSLTVTGKVLGNGGCVPVYGGGVQCPRVGQVLIDKTVRNPSTGIFVDNLGPSDPKYRPQWIITFRVTVKNSGDQTLDKVTVVDKLPQYIDFMSGPGTYDSKGRTLTWDVNSLAGGASQVFEIKGKVVHPAVLPAEKSVVCPVNVADAKSNSQTDHDESQFCIQKELVVPQVPTAGPEHWLLSIAGLSTAGIIGLYLRKKALFS